MSDDLAAALPPDLPVPPPLDPATLARARFPLGATVIDFALALTLLVVLSMALTVAVIVPGLVRAGGDPTGGIEVFMAGMLPAITVAAIVAMLLSAVALWLIRRRSFVGRLAAMPATPAYLLAIGAGVCIQVGAHAVAWLLERGGAELSPSNVEPLVELARTAPWIAWILVVVVGPFAEELLFRHVLLRRFALAGRAVLGVVVVSLLFALLHEPVPGSQSLVAWLGALTVYVGMGAAFGAVYLRTGRFGAAFVAHAVCNLGGMVPLAYSIG